MRCWLGVFSVVLLSLPLWAAAPATIGYQGVLTDNNNQVVNDGSHSLTFKLYTASSGGSALWTETQTVTTTRGVFTAVLGSATTLNISFEQALWLGITIGSDTELSPRVQLSGVPYSITALGVADNAVAAAQIADGTITAADIAGSQVVKSVNSLTEAVTLAAGSNVTITPSGNTLTIASTGGGGGGNTLDAAYDQGGAGIGRTITADNGAVNIQGTGGLKVTGAVWLDGTTGGTPVSGAGTRMMWIPAKAAFRAGEVSGTEWDDASIGTYSTVHGGQNNTASSQWSIVGGGKDNIAQIGSYAMVSGGMGNNANNTSSAIAGGRANNATGVESFVGGGGVNTAGGGANAVVAGGFSNTASGTQATIGGGNGNTATNTQATVGGGLTNIASGELSTVSGGQSNTASGQYSTALGGLQNSATAQQATVAGGVNNSAQGLRTTVGGGSTNIASGTGNATIAGGSDNNASGIVATIPGGLSNTAAGDYSFAAGRRAKANHNGAFVWGDQSDFDIASTATDQLTLRSVGGVRFITAIDGSGNATATANINSGGAVLFDGTAGTTPTSGAGTRLMWIPAKGAFRAGVVAGTQWDDANIGTNSTVGGGLDNTASSGGGTVAGGQGNFAQIGSHATVGGGLNNVANNSQSTIAGGRINGATGVESFVGGGASNTAGGGSNTVVGGGFNNVASGVKSAITGGANNTASGVQAAVGGGETNAASGQYATIAGGNNNTAAGDYSFAAGRRAKANHNGAFVWADQTDADFASTAADQFMVRAIGGVGFNTTLFGIGTTNPQRRLHILASTATIRLERNGGTYYELSVGSDDKFRIDGTATSPFQMELSAPTNSIYVKSDGKVGIGTNAPAGQLEVWGGSVLFNSTTGGTPASGAGTRLMWIPAKGAFRAGVVAGAQWDDANIGTNSTVGGGLNNTASSGGGTVAGGQGNFAQIGSHATVGGGLDNVANNSQSTIAGGRANGATGVESFVGGGASNTAGGGANTIVGGGFNNVASGVKSAIVGGANNTASGVQAAVGGGETNAASGQYATIAGGNNNTAAGDYSFAAGRRAKANHNGAFVWGDQSDFDFASTAANEFSARSTGGVRFVTAIDGSGNATAGVTVAAGGGSWSSISDRHMKENFSAVNGGEVLAKVAAMPIETWNYKSQQDQIRHIGPMAQDFHAAFGVGEDQRRITAVDADGVALAAIQGLYEMMQQQQAQIAALQQENAALSARLGALE